MPFPRPRPFPIVNCWQVPYARGKVSVVQSLILYTILYYLKRLVMVNYANNVPPLSISHSKTPNDQLWR